MKVVQRLDYTRLAEALAEHELVDASTSQQLLAQCAASGELFPELLVGANLVTDWELSRLVCEVFGLPFLPVDIYEPSKDALKGIPPDFLRQHCLVPLDRCGPLLSVAMPGMVPADVLARVAQAAKAQVLPLVGTVLSNRQWLEANLADRPPEARPGPNVQGKSALGDLVADGDWLTMFDTVDEQVRRQAKPKDAA